MYVCIYIRICNEPLHDFAAGVPTVVPNVTVDNSATGSSATQNHVGSGNTTGQGGVMVIIDQDGDGDVGGHSVTLDITGGGSTYDIKQSGIYDNTVNGTFSGDGHEVDIIQSD